MDERCLGLSKLRPETDADCEGFLMWNRRPPGVVGVLLGRLDRGVGVPGILLACLYRL